MRGIIFTEFLELVEEKFGLEMVDAIITQSDLASKGAYTSIGTYDFSELNQLITNLHKNTGISTDQILFVFAEYFFTILEKNYSTLISNYKDPIDILASLENNIHEEISSIYEDAQLPSFKVVDKTKDSLILIYKSSRAMCYFGLGLMNKTFEHFNSKANILLEKIKDDGTEVKFVINRI